MSRTEFVLVCHAFGILTEAEAELAIDGGFPPAFLAIIDMLPESERFEATIRWKGATIIDRENPLIVNMAAAIHIDEWALDEVFSIQWPAPLPAWADAQLHP